MTLGPGTFEAAHGDYARVLKFGTGAPNEYFLVENRSHLGADTQLPSSGLAVYHCDKLGSNELQEGTAAKHYQCALLQADGHLDLEQGANVGDANDLFPARAGVVVSDATTPSSRRWDRSGSGLVISDIGAPGQVIQFRVGGPAEPPAPPATGVTSAETQAVLLIPDDAAAGVESHLELTGGGTIAGIRVTADVIHSFIGDLSIALVSPAGTRVVLRDRAGAGADDLHETWTPATTPALCDLVGEPFAGRWTLHLTDHAGQDTGRLDRWRLEVDPAAAATVIEVAATVPGGRPGDPRRRRDRHHQHPHGHRGRRPGPGAGRRSTSATPSSATWSSSSPPPPAPWPPSTTAPGAAATTSASPTTRPTPRPSSSFAGLPTNGTWTLHVRDVAAVDTGRLQGVVATPLHLTSFRVQRPGQPARRLQRGATATCAGT